MHRTIVNGFAFFGILLSSCSYLPNIFNSVENSNKLWFLGWLALLLFLLSFEKGIQNLRLTTTDFFVVLFFMFCEVNCLSHGAYFLGPVSGEQIALCLLYLATRIMVVNGAISSCLTAFVLIGLSSQLVIAALQFFEILPGFHSYFRISGVSSNPGPFAIYVAALTSASFYLCCFGRGLKGIIALVLFAFSTILLVILFSRSAWVGMIAGITVVLLLKFKIIDRFRQLSIRIRFLVGASASAMSLSMLIFLYGLKIESANGRILILKLTTLVISKHFWLGTGPEKFAANLLTAQADYFTTWPERIRIDGPLLTGEVHYAFNDLWQFTAEYGVPLSLMLCYIIVTTCRKTLSEVLNQRSSNTVILPLVVVITILIASITAYPLHVLSLKVLFWFSVALIASAHPLTATNQRPNATIAFLLKSMLVAFSSFFLIAACHLYRGYSSLQYVMTSARAAVEDVDRLLSKFPFLHHESAAILIDGNIRIRAEQYSQAASSFENGKIFCPDLRVYYGLGFCYRQLGQMRLAQRQYTIAEDAFPYLIRPKYLLAKFFYETGGKVEFREKALEVISFKQKIISREAAAMADEIRRMYMTLD